MGWSCRTDAANTMDKWTDACRRQTGSSNVYESKGARYFWDISRVEHADGAITGTVFKMLNETQCKPTGSFRIEGDGVVTRAPSFLKQVSA